MEIQTFTFNQFLENTIIVSDSTNECIIIDPGCYNNKEKKILENYITNNNLNPVKLINTHCHIDHILGNNFVSRNWGIDLEINEKDLELLNNADQIAKLYGFTNYERSPMPKKFINEDDIVNFGISELNVIFTPGHAPGHISLYSEKDNLIISGDVIFQNSIGRTDLPGGDFNTLIKSIKNKILSLDDNVIIYCGHGPNTTVGNERRNNPFLK
mgnify:FL=1|tara:strand:+ start:988 stop:1626 length:639 start_codon:yes stop_codon:yes gene_type:complete